MAEGGRIEERQLTAGPHWEALGLGLVAEQSWEGQNRAVVVATKAP